MATANPDLAHNNERLRTWLAENPGYWRPMQIADALGVETERDRLRVYNALAGLARKGQILRQELAPPPGKKRAVPLYSALNPRQGGRRT